MAVIKVLALDLERTIVSDAMNREPRPGLFDFLLFCVHTFERVVLFTAVNKGQALAVLTELQEKGFAPKEFVSKVTYVEWEGKYKDLRFVSGVAAEEILFIDDDSGWVAPGQERQYIPIAEYDPYLVQGADTELQRVCSVLTARIRTERRDLKDVHLYGKAKKENMSRLHRAARMGNYYYVAEYLADGDDVDAIGIRDCSPLMIAAGEGYLAIVYLLLRAGADVSLRHTNQCTALHLAASKGHLAVVKALVAHKADVNALSRSGCNPAIEAAQFNHREVVAFLQSQGSEADQRDREGMTADEWLALGGLHGRFNKQFPDGLLSLPGEKKRAEDHVRRLMSEGLTADAYAAKHGRHILVFGYGHDHFADPEVEKWAHRVAEVLFNPALLAECEDRYLTGEELGEAQKLRARRIKAEERRAKKILNRT